jgi:hypothetical protein
MLRVLLVATLAALVSPAAALAAHGAAHGPSAVPLLVEVAAVLIAVVLLLGRHALADLARSSVHGSAALAHALVHRRGAGRAA